MITVTVKAIPGDCQLGSNFKTEKHEFPDNATEAEMIKVVFHKLYEKGHREGLTKLSYHPVTVERGESIEAQ